METHEQEYTPKPRKASPFADSPYECSFVEPEQKTPVAEAMSPAKKRRGVRPLLVVILLIVFCAATAVCVDLIWEGRMERMEEAMDNKFAALEKLYEESRENTGISIAPQGPLTPAQVYMQNIKAVVSVIGLYEDIYGYSEGFGSGFIISADGYVVTNYHVIDGADELKVLTHDGDEYDAKVVGYDETNDIALLKVNQENLPYVKIGSSDALVVGDQVVAIGNPLGELASTMTVGYVSAKDRIVDTDGNGINMLQTDAAINSGNSGGPLFNMNGEVIGITTAKYSGNSLSGATIEGLGFAIPIDDVVGMIEDLREFGYVTGAHLGVYVRDVDANAQSYGLPAGAYVEEVTKDTAAAKAGIKAGDIIVNIGGFDVDSVNSLTRLLRRFDPGETTTITVYRAGKKVYLEITLGEKPVEETKTPTQNDSTTSNQDTQKNWYDYIAPFFDFNKK